MKRVVVILMLAVISFGAYAQTHKGDSSFGLNIGYGFDSENVTLGLDYRHNLTDAVRLVPSITHYVKKDHHSAWAIDLNAHYVVPLSEYFGFYPIGGLSLSFWKWSTNSILGTKASVNENYIGANLGLGGEMYISRELTFGLEVKYQIMKDVDQALFALRLGYNF